MLALLDGAFLSEHAGDWLAWLIDASVKTAVVLGLALASSVVLRRAEARVRHTLWSAALLGVLAVPVLSHVMPLWRLSLLPAFTVSPPQSASTHVLKHRSHRTCDDAVAPPGALRRAQGEMLATTSTPVRGSIETRDNPVGVQSLEPLSDRNGHSEAGTQRPREAQSMAVDPPMSASPANVVPLHWVLGTLTVWLTGTALVLSWLLLGLVRVNGFARRGSHLTDESWCSLTAQLTMQLALPRNVRFLESDEVAVPLTWGYPRPVILLPADAESWSPERRRLVLLHELSHIKRNDWLIQVLAQIACAVYWFNPLVWIAVKRLYVEREQACDDDVIALGIKPSEYATHLLDIARLMPLRRAAPTVTLAMARCCQLKGRVMSVLNSSNRKRRGMALFVPVILSVTGVILTIAAIRPWAESSAPVTTTTSALTNSDSAEQPNSHKTGDEPTEGHLMRVYVEAQTSGEQLPPSDEEPAINDEPKKSLHGELECLHEQMQAIAEKLARIRQQMQPSAEESESVPFEAYASMCHTCHKDHGSIPEQGQSCRTCHEGTERIPEPAQTCDTCHEDGQRVPEQTKPCSPCHEDTECLTHSERMCRARYGDLEHMQEHTQECSSCHGDVEQFQEQTKPCRACHDEMGQAKSQKQPIGQETGCSRGGTRPSHKRITQELQSEVSHTPGLRSKTMQPLDDPGVLALLELLDEHNRANLRGWLRPKPKTAKELLSPFRIGKLPNLAPTGSEQRLGGSMRNRHDPYAPFGTLAQVRKLLAATSEWAELRGEAGRTPESQSKIVHPLDDLDVLALLELLDEHNRANLRGRLRPKPKTAKELLSPLRIDRLLGRTKEQNTKEPDRKSRSQKSLEGVAPDDWDYRVLRVVEGIVQLFERSTDSIWPGCNLARRPWVVYIPDKWALLVNYGDDIAGFTEYPRGWPDIGRPVRFHAGPYQGLVGQLVFDFSLGDLKTIAIGLPGDPSKARRLRNRSPEKVLFEHIVHEVFHQYQHEVFGEIPWGREERYPILDRDNTAAAYLEMRLLIDALQKAEARDIAACRGLARQFIAVRKDRWKRGSSFMTNYERGLELREGTAKYVEVASLGLASKLKFRSRIMTGAPLSEVLGQLSTPQLALRDFEDRITTGSVSPEDMARNRIYPVGAAQALLLDLFGIDWKESAQKAGPDFTFVALLSKHLEVDDTLDERLLHQAKRQYSYDAVLASTDMLIRDYRNGYREALASFEGQPGRRVEITLVSSGVLRSRVSGARKWLADAGAASLCAKYAVYTLKNKDLFLHVKDSGILELDDWDAGRRTVVFFAPQTIHVTVNGSPIDLEDKRVHRFDSLEVTAQNGSLTYAKPGTISSSGRRTTINLVMD